MAKSNGIRPVPKPSGKKGSKQLTDAEKRAVIAKIEREAKVTVPTVLANSKDSSTPKKLVGGRVVAKAEKKSAAKRAAKSESDAPRGARKQRYEDHGPEAKHRYTGISWDGAHLRTTNGSRGLERSTDEGKTWKAIFGDEFEVGNRDRWRRAIEKSKHKKPILPYPAVGAASWLRPRGEGGEKIVREKGARRPRAASERGTNSLAGFSLLQGLPAKEDRERSATCQFEKIVAGHLCKSDSTARVTSGDNRRSADLCAKHEAMVLATKCDLWNPGAISKALPPLPKIAAPAAASAAQATKIEQVSEKRAITVPAKAVAKKAAKPKPKKAAAKKAAKPTPRARVKSGAKRKASKR